MNMESRPRATHAASAAVAAAIDTDKPGQLSEEDAWEIAMTWQPQLQCKVRLLVDHDGPIRSILKSYAWVRLDKPRPLTIELDGESRHREAVSITRAVMLSWVALAACPGFRGSENGTFWKRVISTLQGQATDQTAYNAIRDPLEPVTDAYGFFDLPGHVFPRFMVDITLVFDEASGKFFPPSLSPDIDATLQLLLARIASYACTTPPQTIDLGLYMPKLDIADAKLDLASIVRAVDASCGRHFHICHMQVRRLVVVFSAHRMNAILRFFHHVSVALGHFHLVPLMDNSSSADRAKLAQALLRLDGSSVRACVTSFRLSRDYMDDAMFQALMSALPFARSAHSLSLGMGSARREEMFERVDLPWLAFAIFHPHAASSSWRHLELDYYVLAAMARGNNLLALINGTRPVCDAYLRAEIMDGALIHLEPNPASSVLMKVSLAGMIVDVCGIASLDRATWSEWVAVVVPAYGLGWVRSTQLSNEHALAPASSHLTGLRLCRKKTRNANVRNAPAENVLHLLPPLGPSLAYLNVTLDKSVAPLTLSRILALCSSLQVLVVKHAGKLWSEPPPDGVAPLDTRLEELELIVRSTHSYVEMPTCDHIAASLRNVRALRIRLRTRTGNQLEASQSALEQVLYNAVALRYLHWQRPGQSLLYGPRRGATQTALEKLHLTDPKYLYAQLPISTARVIAFLSVITHASQLGVSALGELVDRGVLMIIFQFATTPMRRSIYIEESEATVGDAFVVNHE